MPHTNSFGVCEIEADFSATLLVVIAIIAVLIGLLLPIGQHGREVANWGRAQKDVSRIVAAESKARGLTTNLAALAKLGLIDPQLGTGKKDGYCFAVAILPTGGFRITAVPAAPGITGASDVMADQTGAVTSKPSKGADEARAAMFAAIDAEAAAAIGQYLSQTPTEHLPEIQRFFQDGAVQEPSVLQGVFKLLDAGGDGKVTLSEIVSYDRKSGSPLDTFLATLNRMMQLGLANEDIQSIPGVGLSDLLPSTQEVDAPFEIEVSRGASSIVAGESQAAVALAGACDGSVRIAESTRVSLDGAEFSALLPAANPHILSGRFLISRDDKVAVHGILIGVLPHSGRNTLQTLKGFFLVTGGSGPLTGAFGSGRASIHWSDLRLNRFDADFEARLTFVLPAVQ